MRILDENDKEVKNPDLDLGYLKQEAICVSGDKFEFIQRYRLYSADELDTLRMMKANMAAADARYEAEKMIENAGGVLDGDQLLAAAPAIPEWRAGTKYGTGSVVRKGSALYRALQNVTTPDDPATAVSLWKRIGEPATNGVFPWSQPLGATDAYVIGDRVLYNGKIYVSTVQYNVWAPDVYGWKLEETTTAEEWPEWVQPTGAHDAYAKGAKVVHNGKHWTSVIDANVWEPSESTPNLWAEVK